MNYIKTNSFGLFTIAIVDSGALDLAYLLDPEVPIVNLSRFAPNGSSGWWSASVPLSKSGPSIARRIRDLSFDLEMSTSEFLANLNVFAPHGLNLLHLRKSLALSGVVERTRELPGEKLTKILLDGGMEARFTLPHAGEVAVYASRTRQTLERALENENIRSRCIEND
jgi:hypothetical protein